LFKMPTPSSSFDGIVSLPPRVVGIRHALLEIPSETAPSVAIPPNYKLYMSFELPVPGGFGNPVGLKNGDWLYSNTSSGVYVYQRVNGAWLLRTSLASGGGGGGGGGGGPITNQTLTNCVFQNGTITGSSITTSTLTAPTITSPIVTGGVFTTPVVTTPVITGGTIDGTSIRNVPTPLLPGDAANKAYVDGASQGFIVHDPCRVSTTGSNITLTGGAPDTLDGITLLANDRILVKNQTNPVQNGIYYVATLGSGSNGTWTRSLDADSGQELDTAYVLVQSGTANGGSSWVVNGTPLINTDQVVWTQFFALTSIPASIITGTINAGQIGTITAGQITGTISAGQISTIAAGQITGLISSGQIGTITAAQITGSIQSGQIQSVAAASITGSIAAGQIGAVNAGVINGVIVGAQLTDQILNTQRLIASDISVVRRLATLPSLPNTDYPLGSLVLNTTNKTLYQNVAGSWSVVTASSNVIGTLTANDIASINANQINGLIISSQIGSVNASVLSGSINADRITAVNATALNGSIDSARITSVNASSLTGSINADRITAVNASALTGNISADRITAINATAITGGQIQASQIAQVNATTITLGSLSAINYTMAGTVSGNTTTINNTGLSVGLLKIDGTTNQNTISIAGFNPITLSGGQGSASLGVGNQSFAGAVAITYGGNDQINIRQVGTLGNNGSGRYAMSSASTNSIAFSTNGSERWIVGGSDGHLKSMGSYDIRKASGDGWSVPMHDGSNSIEFRWDAGFQIRVDGPSGSVYNVTIT
jgi:hypothetical protein